MNAEYTGNKIKELRNKKGFTQKQLAEKLFVTDKAVSKWERGINYPDIALLDRIANELDVTVVELLGLENSSSDEVVTSMTILSKQEKEQICANLFWRGILSVVFGIAIIIVLTWTIHVIHGIQYEQAWLKISNIITWLSFVRVLNALLLINGGYTIWKSRKLTN